MPVELLSAADVARLLGVSRRRVAELAASAPDFPPPAADEAQGWAWDRRAVEAWAAVHPDRGPAWRRPPLRRPGEMPRRVHQLVDIAAARAKELNHPWIGDEHLLLALLEPDSPGTARAALESFGVSLDAAKDSLVESVGLHERAPTGMMHARAMHDVLERANLEALELRDEEVSSEHVLLALADAWERTPARPLLAAAGIEPAALRRRVLALSERAASSPGPSGPDSVAAQPVDAAEVARILGVSRRRVGELASSAPDFPPSEVGPRGYRVWSRHAVEGWAVAHPDRGPGYRRLDPPPPGRMAPHADRIFEFASAQARELNHGWVGPDHLLLALLHPDCPGPSGEALASLGLSLEEVRDAWIESMGDPFDPYHGEHAVPPATHHVLERATLTAVELQDEAVTGEHVLLALTDDWGGGLVSSLLAGRGIDATTVRRRLIDVTDGMTPVAGPPPPRHDWRRDSRRIPRPPELELAPTPDGHDPRRRKPWGSVMFRDAEGRTFNQGRWLRQYTIDRDGNPVLTTDGRPLDMLVDAEGHPVLDEEGNAILAAVDVPPGCQVRAYPRG